MIHSLIHKFLLQMYFGQNDRKKVYKRLASQIGYNVNLVLCFELLQEQAEKRKRQFLVDMYAYIIEHIKSGQDFHLSLKDYIPADEYMLIQAGDKGGTLADGFLLARKIIEAKQNILSSVRSAIAYPLFLGLMLIVLMLAVTFLVMPNFALISDPTTWTGSAYALYLVSDIIASPIGALAGIILVLLIAFISYSFANLTGQIRKKLDKYPPYSVYRLTVGATWLFTVASLMKSGKIVNDILEEMIKSDTNSHYLKERMEAIIDNFGSGTKFGEALVLADTDFPDAELVYDLKIYSTLPDFNDTLYRLAEDWLTESIDKIKEDSKILNNICISFIAIILLNIVFAFQNIQTTLYGV